MAKDTHEMIASKEPDVPALLVLHMRCRSGVAERLGNHDVAFATYAG